MIGFAPGSSEDIGSTALRMWQQQFGNRLGQGGGWGADQPAAPPPNAMPQSPTTGAPIVPTMQDPNALQQAMDLGNKVNQYNLDYMGQGIPNYYGNLGSLSNRITDFLNPNDPQANYDTTMHGAEWAAGAGIAPGSSGIGGEYTGRLRQADIERRAALGANLLGQEVSWLPKPYDVSQQFITPIQTAQLQQQEKDRQLRLAALQWQELEAQLYGHGRGGYGYPASGIGRSMPAPVAASGGGFSGGYTGPQWREPTFDPSVGAFGGGPSEPPPAGATIYQNPGGSVGWGYAPPPSYSDEYVGIDPDTGQGIPYYE